MDNGELPPGNQDSKKKRRTRDHKERKSSRTKELVPAIVENNGLCEYFTFPRDEEAVASFREYFTNRKPFLLFMDFHSLRLSKKTRRQRKTPDSPFRCAACDASLASFEDVDAHVQKRSHIRQLRENWQMYVILNVNPSPEIIDKIDESLETEFASSAATQGVLSLRRNIFERVNEMAQQVLPQVVLRMVGSSYHGLGLADCDLNMAMYLPSDKSIAGHVMSLNSWLLSEPGLFQDFEKHLCDEKKPPYFSFKWKGTIPCTILIKDHDSLRLTKLINEYGKIDDRCKKLCVLFRKWASICRIDGKREGCWPSHAFYILVIYFLQQLQDPVLPVLHELLPIGSKDYEDVTDSVRALWKTKNTSNLGTLWIQLFTFYAYEFDSADILVSISQSALKQRSTASAAWRSGKRIAIMSPYDPEVNFVRGVSNSTLYQFILHCLKKTCTYYRIPQCKEGPLFGYVRPEPIVDPVLKVPGHAEFLDVQLRLSHYIVRLIPHLDSNYLSPTASLTPILEKLNNLKSLYVNICSFNLDDFTNFGTRAAPRSFKYRNYALFLGDAQYLMNHVNPEKLKYQFSSIAFTDGEDYPQCCSICQKNGHSQDNCPDLMLEQIVKIPNLDKELIDTISQICLNVYLMSRPSKEDVARRDQVVEDLEEFITDIFPEACLTLFGSSRNGFGLKNSDLDICLTFSNLPTNAGVPSTTLLKLFRHLKKCREIRNLIHIQSAKVPIIKFQHYPTGLEGDISLYNTLAQENTKMLRCYSEIDERVKILGYMVKQFARVCSVGDASKGSLSSYCYILMLFYFLQRCDPPVIPVLQTLPQTGQPLPKRFVDGHNTYFYDDVENLGHVWPGYKKNKKLVGELWIEMLRFYTEQFDPENVVVSIRTDKTVLKLEKSWFTKVFAIEDPFDTSHNLGAGLSRKMNVYIIKAFRNARQRFTSKLTPSKSENLVDCYFNEEVLAPGEPPNDRGCLFCKCIGHRIRDCPRRMGLEKQHGERRRENRSQPSEAQGEMAPPNERFAEGNRLLASFNLPKDNPRPTNADLPQSFQQKNPEPVNAARSRVLQDAQNLSYKRFINSLGPK
ncbi:Hypothetical protein NTJ_13719 [Nesidiocoris tenuis]|uniref:C2H2-type domain-containing protein n=1 Tax=Nesidiocoris tenuis TaxID=355587 RepID=A0ABN7B945_9HEMI|nr:Hypothetical protein NTJ_13719 [Nesidiocoris tenuis]